MRMTSSVRSRWCCERREPHNTHNRHTLTMKMMPRVATASLALAHQSRGWKPTIHTMMKIGRHDACLIATRNRGFSALPVQYYRGCSRLFGSKAGSGIPGEIYVEDGQLTLPNIDQDRLRVTLTEIRKLIGYETYDVSLLLIEDEEMRETNLETRGVDDATDILSFQFHEAIKPGLIQEPEFDIPEYYTLGDLLIDVPYVIRSCQDDQTFEQDEGEDKGEEEEEEEEDDRGVSGAMAKVYDPEQRIHMLLVHGMLHLVGYDHEEDDDYEEMVTKEEEILRALKLMP
jgi:probable rRNA maturation factor